MPVALLKANWVFWSVTRAVIKSFISKLLSCCKGKIHPEAEFTLCYSKDVRQLSHYLHTQKCLPVPETIASRLNLIAISVLVHSSWMNKWLHKRDFPSKLLKFSIMALRECDTSFSSLTLESCTFPKCFLVFVPIAQKSQSELFAGLRSRICLLMTYLLELVYILFSFKRNLFQFTN